MILSFSPVNTTSPLDPNSRHTTFFFYIFSTNQVVLEGFYSSKIFCSYFPSAYSQWDEAMRRTNTCSIHKWDLSMEIVNHVITRLEVSVQNLNIVWPRWASLVAVTGNSEDILLFTPTNRRCTSSDWDKHVISQWNWSTSNQMHVPQWSRYRVHAPLQWTRCEHEAIYLVVEN